METTKKILITGGSGMIGKRLTTLLLREGYEVSHLSRSKRNAYVKTFFWDPYKKVMDRNALENIEVIIHLAGAGIDVITNRAVGQCNLDHRKNFERRI